MNTWKRWKPRLRKLPRALLYDFPWSAHHTRLAAFLTLTVSGLVTGALQGVVVYAWCFGDSTCMRGDSFAWDTVDHFTRIGIALGVAAGIAVSISRNFFIRISLGGLLGCLLVTLALIQYSGGRPIYVWGGYPGNAKPDLFHKPLGWGLILGGPAALLIAGLAHLLRRCSRKIRLLSIALTLITLLFLRSQGFFWDFWMLPWEDHRDHFCCMSCFGQARPVSSSIGAILFPLTAFLICLLNDLAEQLLRRINAGKWLVVALAAATVAAFAGFSWAAETMPSTPASRLVDMAFTSESDRFVTVHEGEALRLWRIEKDAETGQGIVRLERRFRMHRAPVRYTKFALCSDLAAAGSEDGWIDLWSLPECKPWLRIEVPGWSISSLAISPDGCVVAAAGLGSTIRLWELTFDDAGFPAAVERPVVNGGQGSRYGYRSWLRFSPDGRMIFLAPGEAQSLACYDVRSGKLLAGFGQESRFNRWDPPVFSPDRRTLACSYGAGAIQLIDPIRGSKRVMQTHLSYGHPLDFSPDGRSLAIGNSDATLIVDLSTGKVRKTFARSGHEVLARFSPDGRWLVAADGDEEWQVRDARAWATLPGETR